MPNGVWGSSYAVGGGVYVQSATDPTRNGAGAFSPAGSNAYYTISAISSDDKTLTLQWGQVLTAESNVSVGVAPVDINIASGVADVKFVLVSQSRDVAIAPAEPARSWRRRLGSSTSARKTIWQLANVVSTGAADVRIKTQGDITNAATSGVNVQGSGIVLEAGQGFIGTSTTPVTIQVDANGSLTARAKDDIYISAPNGDIPVEGVFASGGVSLGATGSIYDAITSDFAKIQASWLELQAGGSIGQGSVGTGDASLRGTIELDALHVNISSTFVADSGFDLSSTDGALRALAQGNIDIYQTDGNLNVLDAYSTTGDVMLEAGGTIYGGSLTDPTDLGSAPTGNDFAASVYGNSIFLVAGISTALSGIGNSADHFNIVSSFSGGADSGFVSALAGDANIYLDEATTTRPTTSNGDISLVSVSAGADATAFITTAFGSILNARPDDNAILIAGKADLAAQTDVGAGSDRANGFTGRITSTTGNIEAQATTGNIWLWNIGAVDVGGVTADPYALYAPKGTVDIQASSPVTVINNVLAYGYVTKQAGKAGVDTTDASRHGDPSTSPPTPPSDLTIAAGVTITSETSYVELDAANNIFVLGDAIITAATAITLNAGYLDTTAPAEGGDEDSVFIRPGATLRVGAVSAGAFTAATAGTLTINAGNDVEIDGASTSASAAALTAATIAVNGGYLSANRAFDGNSVVLDLYGSFHAQTLNVTTGGGNDDVEFSPAALDSAGFTAANTILTNIQTGAGDDFIHAFNMPNMATMDMILQSQFAPIPDVVNLDGQDGADTYQIDATASSIYVINVHDSGALDSGLNTLVVNGATTTHGQTFLLRDGFVAIVDSDGNPAYQRINYDDTITNRLEINGGDVTGTGGQIAATDGDSYYLDGNAALMTVNASPHGNDVFQVGQQYYYSSSDPTLDAIGAAVGDVGAGSGYTALFADGMHTFGDGLTTTRTTVGDLSDGVDKATVLYGGGGADRFEVYSNQADLSMIGGSGDDTFVVRAFLVAAGTHLNVAGGSGHDTIEYNSNAPLDIEGGTGFNTLILLGTEANDTFVITANGIFGAGLNVSYTNIQALTIDGLGGNDTFYVLGTPQGAVTTINGGDGGDTVIVGGDVTGPVISSNTEGASSTLDHAVTSSDTNYNGLFVNGISVTVGGAAGAIIDQPSKSIVYVGDPSSTTSFTVNAPPGLEAGKVAYVNISPALPSAEWGAQGAPALQVSVDGGKTWTANATLEFVGGQTSAQTVLLRAAPTPANDTYTRDETIVVAASVISQDQPELDSLVLPTVKVTLVTSASGLIIDQGVAATTIVAGETSYNYRLSLTKAPAAGQTVTVNLTGANGGALSAGVQLSQSTVTFDSTNWDQPQTITVSSTLTGSHPAQAVDIEQSINGFDVGDVNLNVAATNTPGVLILQPQGAAFVSPTQNYTYQMVLTSQPTADVTVSLLGDGQTYATTAASGTTPVTSVTFTAANWNVPVSITLHDNPNYVAPTGGQGTNPTTDMTFPNQPHTLAQIYGPLIIDGGTQPGQPTLVAAVALPYETHNPPVTEPTTVETNSGIDIVKVYDDGAATGQTGQLTTIPAGDVFGGQGDESPDSTCRAATSR